VRAGRLGFLRNRRGGQYKAPLSFFVMVLAFSRQMFVEFTVSQTMEPFPRLPRTRLRGFRRRAFQNHGRQSQVAVLHRLAGAAPVFNPRYLDFARHHAFAIEAAMSLAVTRKAASSEVSATSKEFPAGLELTGFSTIHAAAQVWLDTVANVASTAKRNSGPSIVGTRAATSGTAQSAPLRHRPHFDQCRLQPIPHHPGHQSYSVPAAYAHRRLTVKAYPDRVCIYFDNQLIARHTRHYGRHEDIEEPDHAKV